MSSKTYLVEPQRPTGHGWTACAEHEARRWSVIELTRIRTKRHQYVSRRTIANHLSKALAEETQLSCQRNATPLAKPRLGARFAATGRKIIAKSLRKGTDYNV